MAESAERGDRDELSWSRPDADDAPPRSERGDDTFVIGALIAERYKLYKFLGKGAVGTVWEAYDQRLARPVALKLIRTDAEPEMAERVVKEAKAAAALHTVHVVAVHDNGVHLGVPFIVMERLEGETLSDVIKRHGSLRIEQVASLLMQCAAGLRCAHERGIIHRDLKPDNLFVSRSEDGYETIKILDFGVAKAPDRHADGETTESGVILGTPHYMSPEQARGLRGADQRSDLWSVAVILYRCLTGHRPWTGATALDVLMRVCSEDAKPPSELSPDLPPALDGFFEKAFHDDVDQRFQSIDELRDAFIEAADVRANTLRDQPGSALSSGSFVMWDSAADLPRPRVSDPGSSPSVPSRGSVSGVQEIGSLSASSSVRDFLEHTEGRRRPWAAMAAIATMFFGGVMAAVVLEKNEEAAPPTTTAAPNVPLAAPSRPDATTAPTASASAPAAASSSARPRQAPRAPLPVRAPKPQPDPSPTGKKRLPLY